jgi:hypothetical protein
MFQAEPRRSLGTNMHASQHTPGPWKYLDRGNDHTNHLIANEKGDAGIAQPIARIHEPEKLYIEEMRANARLIAAAPDLLAALIQLRQVANWGEDSDRQEFVAAMSAANLAIAQALDGAQ